MGYNYERNEIFLLACYTAIFLPLCIFFLLYCAAFFCPLLHFCCDRITICIFYYSAFADLNICINGSCTHTQKLQQRDCKSASLKREIYAQCLQHCTYTTKCTYQIDNALSNYNNLLALILKSGTNCFFLRALCERGNLDVNFESYYRFLKIDTTLLYLPLHCHEHIAQ